MLEYDDFFLSHRFDESHFLNSSRCDIQRLAGIRSLSSVIISDRDETFRRLLPKFKVHIFLKALCLYNRAYI
jgi:hypothetical protein